MKRLKIFDHAQMDLLVKKTSITDFDPAIGLNSFSEKIFNFLYYPP